MSTPEGLVKLLNLQGAGLEITKLCESGCWWQILPLPTDKTGDTTKKKFLDHKGRNPRAFLGDPVQLLKVPLKNVSHHTDTDGVVHAPKPGTAVTVSGLENATQYNGTQWTFFCTDATDPKKCHLFRRACPNKHFFLDSCHVCKLSSDCVLDNHCCAATVKITDTGVCFSKSKKRKYDNNQQTHAHVRFGDPASHCQSVTNHREYERYAAYYANVKKARFDP